jgi:hypothetical protein
VRLESGHGSFAYAPPEPVRPDGIVLSKGWLAVAGTLFALLTGLLSWGMAETTARSTQALQLEQQERRLAALEARQENGRATSNDTHTAIYKRIGDVSDRVARLEARLDMRRGRLDGDDPAGWFWPGCLAPVLPTRL